MSSASESDPRTVEMETPKWFSISRIFLSFMESADVSILSERLDIALLLPCVGLQKTRSAIVREKKISRRVEKWSRAPTGRTRIAHHARDVRRFPTLTVFEHVAGPFITLQEPLKYSSDTEFPPKDTCSSCRALQPVVMTYGSDTSQVCLTEQTQYRSDYSGSFFNASE